MCAGLNALRAADSEQIRLHEGSSLSKTEWELILNFPNERSLLRPGLAQPPLSSTAGEKLELHSRHRAANHGLLDAESGQRRLKVRLYSLVASSNNNVESSWAFDLAS